MTADITSDTKPIEETSDSDNDDSLLKALDENNSVEFMGISGKTMQNDLVRIYDILHRMGCVHKIQRLQLASGKKNTTQRGRI